MTIRYCFCLVAVLMSQASHAQEWVTFSESPSIKLEISMGEPASDPGIKKIGVRTQFLGKLHDMALQSGFDQTEFDMEFNCKEESFRHVGEYRMFREGKPVKSEQVKGTGAWTPLEGDSDEYALFDHVCPL